MFRNPLIHKQIERCAHRRARHVAGGRQNLFGKMRSRPHPAGADQVEDALRKLQMAGAGPGLAVRTGGSCHVVSARHCYHTEAARFLLTYYFAQ